MLGNKRKEGFGAPEEKKVPAWDEPPAREPIPDPAAARTAAAPAGQVNTFIGKGSEFVGKLTFDGTVRIDGRVQGEIYSKGTLVIGPGAEIKAAVFVESCQIMGTVFGNVHARQRLELAKPGRLYGDIRTPTLILEAGVIFEGNCRMENLEAAERPAPPKEPPRLEIPVKAMP